MTQETIKYGKAAIHNVRLDFRIMTYFKGEEGEQWHCADNVVGMRRGDDGQWVVEALWDASIPKRVAADDELWEVAEEMICDADPGYVAFCKDYWRPRG